MVGQASTFLVLSEMEGGRGNSRVRSGGPLPKTINITELMIPHFRCLAELAAALSRHH